MGKRKQKKKAGWKSKRRKRRVHLVQEKNELKKERAKERKSDGDKAK